MQKFDKSTQADFKVLKNEFVTFYEGVEGIKEVYKDTLTATTYLHSIVQPSEVEPELYKWLTTEYVKERVKKGVQAYVVVSTDNKDDALQDYLSKSRDELRITHVINPVGHPFENEIIIYDDKVAFIQYNPKYSLSAILIKHKPIANTMRAMFLHFLWKSK